MVRNDELISGIIFYYRVRVLIYNNIALGLLLLSVIIQLVTAGKNTKTKPKKRQLCACVHEVSVNRVSIIILVSEDKHKGNEEVSFYAHSVMLRLHPR